MHGDYVASLVKNYLKSVCNELVREAVTEKDRKKGFEHEGARNDRALQERPSAARPLSGLTLGLVQSIAEQILRGHAFEIAKHPKS